MTDFEYRNWLAALKSRYHAAQVKAAVSVNGVLIEFYWALGRDIEERFDENHYGAAFFERLSNDLCVEIPNVKGLSPINLRYANRFYRLYRNLPQLVEELAMVPWSSHRLIIDRSSGDTDKAAFYVRRTIENNWSRSQLDLQLDAKLYETTENAIDNFGSQLPVPDGRLARELIKSEYSFALTETSVPSRLCASVLKPTPTQSPILDWQAKARNDGLVLTNLYPDPRKMDDWMRRDAAVAVTGFADCRLLVVHEGDFDRLFYAAKSLEAASKACASYAVFHKIDCVLDVIGPQPVQTEAATQFCKCGFEVRKTLTRMQRRKGGEDGRDASPIAPATSPAVRLACDGDAAAIHAALHQYFDPRAEQLPCMEEVRELCTNGASFVVEDNGSLAAFLLGEIQGKKGTVRYWFTMPEGRGKGTGGVLMHAFFDLCLAQGSTFQELWVIDDNNNAIKRYDHYGFAFDRLKDSVFVTQSHGVTEEL